jgi:DNA ligase-1
MEELRLFIDEMQATSSSLDKVAILKRQSEFIQKVLEYTYNPYKQYHVTSKTIKKNPELFTLKGYDDLFDLLDALNKRTVTGHKAISCVNQFIADSTVMTHDDTELLYRIIDKDLEIRAGAKVINKAFPGLIPEFNVALAKEYDGKCEWNDNWYASRKLDGVRCLAVVNEEGTCTLYSRMGKEFTTLNKIKEAIEATNIINTVFDGEVCLMDEDGNEDFQGIMKQLRRKDHQIKNPVFMIFDMIHKPDFDKNKSEEILSERLHKLRSWIGPQGIMKPFRTLRYLDQFQVTGDEHFSTWNEMANDNNWEGFMVRKDVGYEGKRSKNLLKVKTFHDAEYTVIDAEVDEMRIVKDGREEYLDMLAQVWIEHKGYKVKVGSGFTQEQRLKYAYADIIGKTITVQYFEETKNDKGGISLRFPTVKHIYENERDC